MFQEGLKGNFAAIEIIERALEDEELQGVIVMGMTAEQMIPLIRYLRKQCHNKKDWTVCKTVGCGGCNLYIGK